MQNKLCINGVIMKHTLIVVVSSEKYFTFINFVMHEVDFNI